MTLHVASDGLHVYDDIADVWHRFEDAGQVAAFLSEGLSEPEGVPVEVKASGSYNAFSITLGTGSPVVELLPYDETRVKALFTCTSATGKGFALIGKPSLLGSANPQGFPVLSTSPVVTFETIEPVYCLAQGSEGCTVYVATFND
jgi:hypothetical protein